MSVTVRCSFSLLPAACRRCKGANSISPSGNRWTHAAMAGMVYWILTVNVTCPEAEEASDPASVHLIAPVLPELG